MTDAHEGNPALTKNQALVFGCLTQAEAPLSAYTILDQLRDDGLRAPLQVYRALDKLVDFGLVHRLESLNAFVACNHPAGETSGRSHGTVAFAICEKCEGVTEFAERMWSSGSRAGRGRRGFMPTARSSSYADCVSIAPQPDRRTAELCDGG